MPHTHLLHTQMIEAIKAQNLTKVQNLMAEGVKVNYVNHSCAASAIEAATKVGNIEIVDFLIKSKADPNQWYMRSPLVIALDEGFIDIANLLIDAGADINTDPDMDYTPLMGAVCLNSIELVKKLINAGADVDVWGKESSSPLSEAGRCAYREIFEYLFPLVNPNYRNQFLEEGLINAIIDNSLVGIEFLTSKNVNINCIDFTGETPLICAIINGHPSSAKKLIELGADITLRDNKGKTALDYAIYRNYSDIIQLLTQSEIIKD